METLILLIVIGITILLGRYAITEGQRVEQNKEFLKNMENFDKKNKDEKK